MQQTFDALARAVRDWMADRKNNAIAPGEDDPAFDEPLLGCAAGDDPLFARMRDDIGPDFYWTPEEAFRLAYPDEEVRAGELCVVAWVLPQTAKTRAAHAKMREMPSIEWSKARLHGEGVNKALRQFVVDELARLGVASAAPTQLPEWRRETSPRFGFASTWSERHAAHACGLGTFGLSDGLITPRGKAVRVGSVVARAAFPATPRPYATHNAWCLHYATGRCGACEKRCPAGAISEAGHDKTTCKAYIRGVTAPYTERETLGIRVNNCGLCQVKVPCESRIPKGIPKDVTGPHEAR